MVSSEQVAPTALPLFKLQLFARFLFEKLAACGCWGKRERLPMLSRCLQGLALVAALPSYAALTVHYDHHGFQSV